MDPNSVRETEAFSVDTADLEELAWDLAAHIDFSVVTFGLRGRADLKDLRLVLGEALVQKLEALAEVEPDIDLSVHDLPGQLGVWGRMPIYKLGAGVTRCTGEAEVQMMYPGRALNFGAEGAEN